jgi:hypothetical protein
MGEDQGVLKVMPGDNIEWDVEFTSRARISYVWATFVCGEETDDPRNLVLGGPVTSFEKTDEGRISYATLGHSEEHSDPVANGDYLLSSMNAITMSEVSHYFDAESLPSMVIRREPEPESEAPKLRDTRIRIV